jgi:hypothetical protein
MLDAIYNQEVLSGLYLDHSLIRNVDLVAYL